MFTTSHPTENIVEGYRKLDRLFLGYEEIVEYAIRLQSWRSLLRSNLDNERLSCVRKQSISVHTQMNTIAKDKR